MVRTTPIGKLCTGIWIDDKASYDPKDFLIAPYYQSFLDHVVLSPGMVNDRIKKLAFDIYHHYLSSPKLTTVCTLKGAARFYEAFTAELREIAKHRADVELARPVNIDYYVRSKSYIGTKSGPDFRMDADIETLKSEIEGGDVLIVEDLVDTGRTLVRMKEIFDQVGARDVKTVCLLAKRVDDWNGFVPDWVGFDVPGKFLVGFGIDLDEHFRDLDPLCVINELAKNTYGIV